VKSHVLSASATQVTIADEGQVKITFTEKGTLEYDVDDWDIADCEWGEWKGNTIPLYLTGYENGTTVITISNTYNNEKLYINVTVELDSEEW
jgi:hypothetical protein